MKSAAARRPDQPPPAPAPGDYRLEDSPGHLLRRAHQRYAALFQRRLAELQLTPTQFAALVKLRDQAQVTQNQLGRLTAMDPATIQGVIQRLEARQLIERHPDPDDRRRTMLRLNAAGAALVGQATGRARAVWDATLAPLSAAERQTLVALLRKLI